MATNIGIQVKSWAIALWRDPAQFLKPRQSYQCPCCGYSGRFPTAKKRVPIPFRCPNCESRPRDRQIFLYLERNGIQLLGRKVLNFAPEWPVFRLLRNEESYVGGDIIERRNANAIVDITDIKFDDNSFDVLICNHVLEHVPEDRRAMQECYRVMSKGGMGIFSVPLSGEEQTWEPPEGMSTEEIEAVCGWDHKRLYGFDFAKKLEDVGFSVFTFSCDEDDRKPYCLLDDVIFVVEK